MKIKRHCLTVRLTHWMIALNGFILLFSGFGQMPMYKRYNIVHIPGLAFSSNYEITLVMHYISAALFSAAVTFHVIYHLRRAERALLPQKGDVKETIQFILAMVGMAEMPKHGKFQAKQRLLYGICGVMSLLLVITGLIKSYKNFGDVLLSPFFLQIVAFAHTLLGMLFLVFVLAHVAALLFKAHRPLLPSMITGYIDRNYVFEHHPEWHKSE